MRFITQRLDWIVADVRYAVRQLVSSPVFAATAILSLAIPIALNTALFAVFSALLLRPVGAPGAGELVRIGRTVGSEPSFRSSDYDEYEYLRDHARSFEAIAGGQIANVTVVAADGAATAAAEVASGNYFTVLGVRPQLGRLFAPDEDRVRNERPVVVVSDRYWRRRFGADPAIVGQTITVNTVAFTVIGVAAPGFAGAVFPGVDTDVWIPTMMADVTEPRNQQSLLLLGRVKPGVPAETVTAELATLARGYADINPERGGNRGFAIIAARGVLPLFQGILRAFLLLLMAAAGAVLLIACADIASLLLARAGARRTELAVRLALGASRGRVISQLMLESLVLAACGGAAALTLSAWSINAVNALALPPGPTGTPMLLALQLDVPVLVFTAGVTIATTMLFGLAPALQATRVDLVAGLKDTPSLASRKRSRLRSALVVVQVALSAVLLIGAVLLFRSGRQVAGLELGFDPDRVVIASFNLQMPAYDRPRMEAFHQEMLRRARLLPGVEHAALANFVPMGGGGSVPVTLPGVEPRPGERDEEIPTAFSIPYNRVSPDYFATLGQPLAAGREFTDRDDATAPRVAIVNEVMANRSGRDSAPLARAFASTRPTMRSSASRATRSTRRSIRTSGRWCMCRSRSGPTDRCCTCARPDPPPTPLRRSSVSRARSTLTSRRRASGACARACRRISSLPESRRPPWALPAWSLCCWHRRGSTGSCPTRWSSASRRSACVSRLARPGNGCFATSPAARSSWRSAGWRSASRSRPAPRVS